jgi:hypothetical protein
MSWKLLQQQTLADAFVSEHEAIKELDELNALINWKEIEQHMTVINRAPLKTSVLKSC